MDGKQRLGKAATLQKSCNSHSQVQQHRWWGAQSSCLRCTDELMPAQRLRGQSHGRHCVPSGVPPPPLGSSLKREERGTSVWSARLGICLAVQGMWVQSLAEELTPHAVQQLGPSATAWEPVRSKDPAQCNWDPMQPNTWFMFKGRDESSTHLIGPFEEQGRRNACKSPAWPRVGSLWMLSPEKRSDRTSMNAEGPRVSWGHRAPSRHGCPGNVPQFRTSTPANKCGFFDTCALLFGEGNGNPLQCSCQENPRDGGAWSAAIYGVT